MEGIFSETLVVAEGGILSIGCSKMEAGRLEAVSRLLGEGGCIHLSNGVLRFSSKRVRVKEAIQREIGALELGSTVEKSL